MSLPEQIQKDIVTAMKAKDEARLSTLRMVKSALHLRQVEKMAPLDEKESQAVLATLIKQRKESVEQFTKGGRQEMADKEAAEIVVIETYLPKAASEAEIVAGVKAAIAEMGAPTMKEMGTVMKNAMARFNAAGMRVDGKMVSEIVKRELAGKSEPSVVSSGSGILRPETDVVYQCYTMSSKCKGGGMKFIATDERLELPLYGLSEAALYLRVPIKTLEYWAFGRKPIFSADPSGIQEASLALLHEPLGVPYACFDASLDTTCAFRRFGEQSRT